MKTIVMTAGAAKMFDALPTAAQQQIASGLDLYATRGVGDIKALQGQSGYRLRIGRYRVLFAEDRQTILVIQVGKRETTTYR
ncbi:type II toxin-antitoxin system RelE/ParE family toxin [Devosia ginsengisoli]|uniref:type II toxin-antitoxin system RelE family toxin n=1 Tax=Devosia ginsengisoli TaxID=400770 RepID=UPI0026EAECC8|nr:plasmid stabilization protein [Devosia ginsengisoli]MCR6671055.1 plasmid stabilization protein [Devosia ginsengisoli]